jgi:hypothetical protein
MNGNMKSTPKPAQWGNGNKNGFMLKVEDPMDRLLRGISLGAGNIETGIQLIRGAWDLQNLRNCKTPLSTEWWKELNEMVDSVILQIKGPKGQVEKLSACILILQQKEKMVTDLAKAEGIAKAQEMRSKVCNADKVSISVSHVTLPWTKAIETAEQAKDSWQRSLLSLQLMHDLISEIIRTSDPEMIDSIKQAFDGASEKMEEAIKATYTFTKCISNLMPKA